MKKISSPTLKTIRMVERTIQKDSIISVPGLKRALPKQVNHNTLRQILLYLEESNKIAMTLKGITWIHNENPLLSAAISKGTIH